MPQGTKLGPFLFAVLVNSLLKDWSARIKFVDDATALEVVPRCSPSLLGIFVDEIAHLASSGGMKNNCTNRNARNWSYPSYSSVFHVHMCTCI